jgi:hypothetical protein
VLEPLLIRGSDGKINTARGLEVIIFSELEVLKTGGNILWETNEK